MNTNDWYVTYRDIDKEAMLHVEGRQPKLVCRDWQWRAIELHKSELMDQEVKGI
jgi:hypothetical protein